MEKLKPLCPAGRRVKWYCFYGKTSLVPQNIKIIVSCNSTISFLSVYQKTESKTRQVLVYHVRSNIIHSSQRGTGAKYPATHEWINKMCYCLCVQWSIIQS